MKNDAFTLLEVLVSFIIVSAVVMLITIMITGTKRNSTASIPQLSSTNIIIQEQGMIQNFGTRPYCVFVDKVTGQRIFSFDGSMVVLNSKTE